MTVGNQKASQTLLTSWAQNCGDPWNKVSFQKITKQKKPILQTFFSSLSPCSKAHANFASLFSQSVPMQQSSLINHE
jgi:hypothetical protein